MRKRLRVPAQVDVHAFGVCAALRHPASRGHSRGHGRLYKASSVHSVCPTFGRIAFANTDVTADSGHDKAMMEGQRATLQLLAVL